MWFLIIVDMGIYFIFFGNKAAILLINDSILYRFFLDIYWSFIYFTGTLSTFFFVFAELDMSRDENGRKRTEKTSFLHPFLYFLTETRSGSEKTGTETGSGYAEVRKRTNTDVEPERIMRSNILEYTLIKSQNNIHVRSY